MRLEHTNHAHEQHNTTLTTKYPNIWRTLCCVIYSTMSKYVKENTMHFT